MLCKNRALKNFSKFTGKRLCQSLLFNKVAMPDVIEIKHLRVPLDKVLILDRHLLLEAELQWLYNKQEIQQYNKI